MSAWPPWPSRQGLTDPAVLIGIHLATVAVLIALAGLRFESADYLSMSWQFVSLRELADHLGRSLAYLICQPPAYNLLIGLSLKVTQGYFTLLLWAWHLLWGCLGIWALYGLGRLLSGRRWPGLAAGLLLPLFPDWILYESWANYTFPAMAHGIVLVYLVLRYHRTRDNLTLAGLAGVLNLLMLTRSIYHLVLFGLVLCGYLILVHRSEWKRITLILVLPTLVLTGGWYAKNLIQFGFFGSSSWSNIGLLRTVGYHRDDAFMKKQLLNTPQAYLYRVWKECPGFYCDLVVHYFHDLDHPIKGDIPVLHDLFEENLDGSRLNRNMNNINFLTIDRDAGAAVKRIIAADPLGYLKNVWLSYHLFSNPPTKYGFLKANRERIQGWTEAWEGALYFRLDGPDIHKVTPVFYLYPLLLAGFGVGLFRLIRGRGRSGFDDLTLCAFCLFTAGVSVAAELGENNRFSYLILPLLWTWLLSLVGRIGAGREQ